MPYKIGSEPWILVCRPSLRHVPSDRSLLHTLRRTREPWMFRRLRKLFFSRGSQPCSQLSTDVSTHLYPSLPISTHLYPSRRRTTSRNTERRPPSHLSACSLRLPRAERPFFRHIHILSIYVYIYIYIHI